MRSKGSERFWFVARILVGLLFAYAGFSKLVEPTANFEAALMKYGIFPSSSIPGIARTVPWLEWILGSFLIVGFTPRFSAAGLSALSFLFLVALTSSRLFLESPGTDCGCFGQSGLHLSLRQIFFVDLASFFTSLRLAWRRHWPWSLHFLLLKQRE